MSAGQLAEADTCRWIGVLPVAATEQHGPHLPASTDADIARAMVAATVEQLPHELPATFLPVEEVGWSAEHGNTPGTVSGDPDQLAAKWLGIIEGLKQQGLAQGGDRQFTWRQYARRRHRHHARACRAGDVVCGNQLDAVRLSAGAVQ
jgi:hypothetical protein